MYRMLRPDSVDIDNGTGLEGTGKYRIAVVEYLSHSMPPVWVSL